MKYRIILLLIISAFYIQSTQAQDCNYLVWGDEFDYTGVPDNDKWSFETGGGGWGNNEEQAYTNSRNNSYVENGALFIHAKKNYGAWTSARMVTSGKASWRYGRIEVKAKLPEGRGTWPAIWMMPQSGAYGGWPNSGEIDIMEHVGYDMNTIHGTIHTEAYNHMLGTQKGGSTTAADVVNNSHVYAIEWTEKKITWFVNDIEYYSFSNEHKTSAEWPFDQNFFLILNIAIGGNWGGAQGIDENLTEAIMEIDYVRVYSSELPTPVITSSNDFVAAGQGITFSTQQISGVNYEWVVPEDVTILEGQGSSSITVQWGNKSGEVQVTTSSSCHTKKSAPYKIHTTIVPTGDYLFPFKNEQDSILWAIDTTENNTLSITANDAMEVTFNIQNPTANANIYYELGGVADFTEYCEMVVELKTEAGQAPSNMRIDLIDANEEVNSNDLFKINTFTDDGQYHTYKYSFTDNKSNSYHLNRIQKVRIFINYSSLGQAGTGKFSIKSIKMQQSTTTVVSAHFNTPKELEIYPNPVEDALYVNYPNTSLSGARLSIYSILGKQLFTKQIQEAVPINLSHLISGIYFIRIISKDRVYTQKMVKK